jgi:Zn-dependent M28 family amino/carboxypeptidase
VFVAGEERGLLGSAYFAHNPTFPAGKLAADINYDEANIFGATRDVSLISAGKSSLDQVVETVAKRQGRVVQPDQFPDRGEFYRSDQFSFAHVGVPAIYLHAGTDFTAHPPGWGRQAIEEWELKKYHQPSDKLEESWSFDGMIQDAQLGLLSGWLIAQADTLPSWNPGDEFEAVRKRALAAAR